MHVKELRNTRMIWPALLAACILLEGCGAGGVLQKEAALRDRPYGPYEKNTFDLWEAPGEKTAPLLVFMHGGGFSSGSKENISQNLIRALLREGISVMSINYRLLPEAVYPEHYRDCARAIQFARYHAKELDIDPSRVAAGGVSGGALAALWIGFHDDMADRSSVDPVLAMSTRLSCIVAMEAQTSLLPDTVRAWIGETALKHSFAKGVFFGISPEEMKTPLAEELCREASPVTYVSRDDPPVWLYYNVLDPPTTVNEAIHHVDFGVHLKSRMEALPVECILRTPLDTQSTTREIVDFLLRHFHGVR